MLCCAVLKRRGGRGERGKKAGFPFRPRRATQPKSDPRKGRVRSRRAAAPRSLATESGGPSNRPARKPAPQTARAARRDPRAAGRRLPVPDPTAPLSRGEAHGGRHAAWDFRPALAPPASPLPSPAPGFADNEASRGPRIRQRRAVTSDARRVLQAFTGRLQRRLAVLGGRGNEALCDGEGAPDGGSLRTAERSGEGRRAQSPSSLHHNLSLVPVLTT